MKRIFPCLVLSLCAGGWLCAEEPPLALPVAQPWESFPVLWPLIEPSAGTFAILRADHPGELARWNGRNWRFQPLPDSLKSAGPGDCFLDDRGHLVGAGYDIGPDSVKTFPGSTNDALVQAAAAGAVEFYSLLEHEVALAAPDRLWLKSSDQLNFWKSGRESLVNLPSGVLGIGRSAQFGVVLMGYEGTYRYEQGQAEVVGPPLTRIRALMMGRAYAQAFDRAIFDPQKHLLIVRDADSPGPFNPLKGELFFEVDEFEQALAGRADNPVKIALPADCRALLRAQSGGAWVLSALESQPPNLAGQRLLPGVTVAVVTRGTPLEGLVVNSILEDPAGDLWFETHDGRNGRTLFRYRLSELNLEVAPTPARCGRSLKLSPSLQPTWEAGGVQYVGRFNGGPWQKLNAAAPRLRFPASGDFRCEVSLVKLGGLLKKSVGFQIQAAVELPRTLLERPEVVSWPVKELDWKPPVRVKKTSQEASARLLWRRQGGSWQPLADDGTLNLAGMPENAALTLEFVAEEDGFWRDPSPQSLHVVFQPDYEMIVGDCLKELESSEPGQSAAAAAKLAALGDKVLPILEAKLKASKTQTAAVGGWRRALDALRAARGRRPH